ncbi:MAG: hypothetical protein ACKVUS_00650 [Saprospiraceae bacterium]
MGFVKEPHTVDFHVMDKPWTEEEKQEFSAMLALRKRKKAKQRKSKPTAKMPSKAAVSKVAAPA